MNIKQLFLSSLLCLFTTSTAEAQTQWRIQTLVGVAPTSAGGGNVDWTAQKNDTALLDDPMSITIDPSHHKLYFTDGGTRIVWPGTPEFAEHYVGAKVNVFDFGTSNVVQYVERRPVATAPVSGDFRWNVVGGLTNPWHLQAANDGMLYVSEICAYDDPTISQQTVTVPYSPGVVDTRCGGAAFSNALTSNGITPYSADYNRISQVDPSTGIVKTFAGGNIHEWSPPQTYQDPSVAGGYNHIFGLGYYFNQNSSSSYHEIVVGEFMNEFSNTHSPLYEGTIGIVTSLFHYSSGSWPRPYTPFSAWISGYQPDSSTYGWGGSALRDSMQEVLDVAVDPRNGDIWVLEKRWIKRIDRTSGPLSGVGSSADTINFLSGKNGFEWSGFQNAGMVFDTSGNIYVAFGGEHVVVRFKTSDPTFHEVIAGQQGVPGNTFDECTFAVNDLLNNPTDLAWYDGKLYVVEQGNDRIRVIEPDTQNYVCDPAISSAPPPPPSGPVCECGDGIHQPICGEQCDDGNSVNGDGCNNDCRIFSLPPTESVCGDGVVSGLEQCDDGNNMPGDGCDPYCMFEPGYIPEE